MCMCRGRLFVQTCCHARPTAETAMGAAFNMCMCVCVCVCVCCVPTCALIHRRHATQRTAKACSHGLLHSRSQQERGNIVLLPSVPTCALTHPPALPSRGIILSHLTCSAAASSHGLAGGCSCWAPAHPATEVGGWGPSVRVRSGNTHLPRAPSCSSRVKWRLNSVFYEMPAST